MKHQPDKAIYSLWWEYLHRSDNYKEICQWDREGADINKLPLRYKKSAGTQDTFCMPLNDIGLSQAEYSQWSPYDQILICHEGEKSWLLSPIIKFLTYSGDIYSTSFDDLYQRMKKHAESRRGANKPILFLKDTFADDFGWCKSWLNLRLGRGPTLEELQGFMIDELYAKPFKLRLVIDPVGNDPKEIADDVERIIREHKKAHKLKNEDKHFSWCVAPAGRKQLTEIQRYLDVYDIWKEYGKGRTWKVHVKEKLPYYKNKVDAHRQVLYEINSDIDTDRKNALKLISNAERGIFPGKY